MKNKVNLFIVGAAKAGTTSLSNYLGQSQYVFTPKIKEPNYFCSDIKFETFRNEFKDDQELNPKNLDVDRHSAWINNIELYKKLYKNNNNYKISIDSSTSYLYSKESSKNIYEYNPNAKIIIILRNPIDRAFSHYLMNLQVGYARKNFKEDFSKDINSKNKGWGKTHLYAELGMYYSQVSRYLEVFPEIQLKIILFDDLKNNLSEVMSSICKFLEIEDIQDMDVSRKNVSRVPMMGKLYFLLLKIYKKNRILRIKFLKDLIKSIFLGRSSAPQLKEQDRYFLLSFFQDDIRKLSKLIKKDLNNWH